MSGHKRVAVVTGSNKGIGFAIVRGLCKQFDGDVYLTARNEEFGLQAVEELEKEGLHPKFHTLDITKSDTITKLKTFLQHNYGGLDILVNNAGMAYKQSSTAPFSEQAEVTIHTNVTGTMDVSEALFPLLRPHARVVNLSSFVAIMVLPKCSQELQSRFVDRAGITMAELKALMKQFVESAKDGTLSAKGWPETAYGVSKIGVTVLSIIQQRELLNDSRQDIVVNSADPGYVDTDMSSHGGNKTLDQGADTPLYLALLPPNKASPRGEQVSERNIQQW